MKYGGKMLEKEVLEEIIKHTKSEYPKEACGILVKNKNNVYIERMKNVSDNPGECYLIDTKEQLGFFKKLEKENSEIFAIYHSHTNLEAYPSFRDIELAFYPDVFYIIISLKNFSKPELRIFKIKNKTIEEVTG